MIKFLRSKDDFVGRLLHHIGTSAVMDLLLRLITCIESPDMRNTCIAVSQYRILMPASDGVGHGGRVGGREFEPRPGHYSRTSFLSNRAGSWYGFSSESAFLSKL